MKETHITELSGGYFVKDVAGKVIAGGVFEIELHPERNGWSEQLRPIPADRLPAFVGSFSPKIADEATILSSPKYPGVELVLPPNSEIAICHVRELFRDIHRALAPKTINVKPNPARS